LRDDGYYFSQMGTFVERADNTARILDNQYWVLCRTTTSSKTGCGTVSMVRDPPRCRPPQLPVRLSERTVERLQHRRVPDPAIAKCRARWPLLRLACRNGRRPRPVLRLAEPSLDMAADLYRDLKEKQMRDIYQEGLHDFLIDFIGKNNQFAHQLCEDYNFA
jgi:uncharacterized alpha-E superfamily protein